MTRRLALVGATATGKSALAHALAATRSDLEILSVDSMQVYRGMDVGTAKATAAERAEVTYHLLDVADPAQGYTVGAYQRAATAALGAIEARGHRALLVGGTGLYLNAVVDQLQLPGRYETVRRQIEAEVAALGPEALHAELRRLDPTAAARMEPTNARRVVRALEVCRGSGRPFSSFGPGVGVYPPVEVDLVGLTVSRTELDRRIVARYEAQLDAGFLDEVGRLAARPGGLGPTARHALGYRELLEHLEGRLGLDEAVALAVQRTRRFARRQERWFRRDPRIRWLDVEDGTQNAMVALRGFLEDCVPCA